jgi:hypothetical protein
MAETTTSPRCGECGKPAPTVDGISGAHLCDGNTCMTAAYDRVWDRREGCSHAMCLPLAGDGCYLTDTDTAGLVEDVTEWAVHVTLTDGTEDIRHGDDPFTNRASAERCAATSRLGGAVATTAVVCRRTWHEDWKHPEKPAESHADAPEGAPTTTEEGQTRTGDLSALNNPAGYWQNCTHNGRPGRRWVGPFIADAATP